MTIIISQPVSDVTVVTNTPSTTLNLLNNFDDPFTTGLVASFQLYDTSIGADGLITTLLFDQDGEGAPATVQNFLNYVNDGDYINSIIHRSDPGFVIQGGGFTVNNLQVGTIPTDSPVVNEFSPNRSNLRGTIAMAKQGGNPNSATNQWFFNLADNSTNLDNQNGGFTVFGEVLFNEDLVTLDAIASIPVFNATNINPVFEELPLNIDPNNPVLESDSDYVRFQNITVGNVQEVEFSVVANSRPDLVNAFINNNELVLEYTPNLSGTAEITVSGTNLLGETETDTFNVSLVESNDSNLTSPIFRFQNESQPGTYLFAGQEESNNIRQNFPNFQEEGFSFFVGVQPGDDLIPLYRFQNTDLPGTYLYTGEQERANVLQNFPNFQDEGIAFYVYGAGANLGQSFYRFQNTDLPGTYIFVGEQERANILQNFTNFREEGIAFEVAA